MSSAVHRLQVAIVEGKQSLTQLLQQTKLIAAKLNLEDVEAWVDLELNGYSRGKGCPEYREVITDRLLLKNPYRGWQISGNSKRKIAAHQPIAEIERLANNTMVWYSPDRNFPVPDSLGSPMAAGWPQLVMINPGKFKRILQAVRNELLQWVIKLEERGIKGEDMDFSDNRGF